MDDRVTSSTYDLLKPFPDEAVGASTWRGAAGTATSIQKGAEPYRRERSQTTGDEA